MSEPSLPVQDKQLHETPRRPIIFMDLPVETLSNIFTLLPPPGIVAFGKCCRILQQLSNERQTWTIALRNASAENKVFLPTYPIAVMSTKDLKAACTRSWKLRQQIWNDQELLEPTRVQILFPYKSVAVHNMELVPGGRFLLTADTVQRLCLWDLGHGQDALLSQEPLAMKQFSTAGILARTWLLMQPTADGKGVICCINLAPHWECSLGEIHIMEIYPTSSHPEFKTIGIHQLTEEEREAVDCHNMTRDFFGYHTNELVVWDFRNDAEYRIDCDELADDMLICNDMVLVLSQSGYNIFSITTTNAVCKLELITSASFILSAAEFSMPLTWYIAARDTQSNKQEVHVDIIVRRHQMPWRIHRYTLSTSTNDPGSSPSVTFLQTQDTPDTTGKMSNHTTISYTMSGEESGLVWLGGRSMHLNVSRGDENWEAVGLRIYQRAETEVRDHDWAYSFCPFAARACSLSFRGEIRIMDFAE